MIPTILPPTDLAGLEPSAVPTKKAWFDRVLGASRSATFFQTRR